MPKLPNVLLLMTDQQRFDTIAALGNPIIQTPALDRLVREGTVFTAAYCPSPVCVASRCSLLLGQWAHQTGCTTNAPMPQERTSLMEFLHEAGYQMHGIGKMHFVPESRKLWGFESRDFSEEGGGEDDFTRHLKENGYGHIVAPHGERSEYYYVPQPSQLPERLHHTTWMGDRTLAFLQRRDRHRPFFCWTSFIKPHPPFESPVPWYRLYRTLEMPLPFLPPGSEALQTWWNRLQNRYKYRDQGMDMNLLRTMRAAYYACISFIDYQIGRILDALADEGILDQTLILFTSDHGELLGDYNCYGKRSFLDVAARVPLLARCPERFAAGARCDAPVSLVDVLPTCLAVAGLPTRPEHAGIDLAQVAQGQAERDVIIGQLGQESTGLYMLRSRDFKYVYSAADRTEWLFPTNRWEERSLAGNPAFERALAEHRKRLIEWLRKDGYEIPLDGERWREFPPPPPVPDNPDAWQLFQDLRSVTDRFPPGYAPRVTPHSGLPVRGI
jgi:choline-sulfatase